MVMIAMMVIVLFLPKNENTVIAKTAIAQIMAAAR